MKTIFSLVLTALFWAPCLVAEEVPSFPTPQKEHKWLEQLVGEWVTESEGTAGPGQPTMKCEGTVKTRALGPFWIVSDYDNDVMGTRMHAIQTVGYSPAAKKYIGTWVDSMMGHMWQYEGTVDPSGKTLTLEAEGPNFTQPGKTAMFRDIYEIQSKDHIVQSSQMQDEDGKWVTFMRGNMRRKN